MSSDPETLRDLAARCEAAEWTCRELDLAVMSAVRGEVWRWEPRVDGAITCDRYGPGAVGNPVLSLDQYTGSVDAALALVPDRLSCAVKSPGYQSVRKRWRAHLESGEHEWEGDGCTPALALCAAALRATADTTEGA